jgi:hypothetical protein
MMRGLLVLVGNVAEDVLLGEHAHEGALVGDQAEPHAHAAEQLNHIDHRHAAGNLKRGLWRVYNVK